MLKITSKINQRKMGEEELQSYLKSKKQSGGHRSKKDYNRKNKEWKKAI